jgi:hypothetical protein
MLEPEQERDVTDRLVAAIAEELWRLYGGNEQLNWVEAEAHLRRILDGARHAAEMEMAEEAATGDAGMNTFLEGADIAGAWGVGSAIGALTNAA